MKFRRMVVAAALFVLVAPAGLAAQKVAPLYATASPDTQPHATDKRKQAAVANAAKANAAQPPRVDAGVGNRSIPAGDSIVGNQEKWEKASEAERMRFLM